MSDKMYYTYIMASRSHNLYIGMTSEIEIRVQQHKAGTFEGYSSHYNCTRLVYFERHPYVNDAIAREKQLKGWRREKKLWLIERQNPTWQDLSQEWGTYRFYRGEVDATNRPADPSTTSVANNAPNSAQDDNLGGRHPKIVILSEVRRLHRRTQSKDVRVARTARDPKLR